MPGCKRLRGRRLAQASRAPAHSPLERLLRSAARTRTSRSRAVHRDRAPPGASSFRSARMATALARVSRPRSCAAMAAEVAAGEATPWIEISRPASLDRVPRCRRCSIWSRWSVRNRSHKNGGIGSALLGPVIRPAFRGLEERLLNHVRRGRGRPWSRASSRSTVHPRRRSRCKRQDLAPVRPAPADRGPRDPDRGPRTLGRFFALP